MTAVSETRTLDAGVSFESYSPGRKLECRIIIIQEEDGFSAHAADLPGTLSEGDTIDEAVNNIADALQCTLAEYRLRGQIPWSRSEIDGDVVCEKRILVDV